MAPPTASSSRRAGLGIWLLLFLALAAAVKLWWPPARFLLVMPSDDTQLMAIDRAVLAGHWDRLLTPQDVHVYPLFRLIRLYFELHFVERYSWLQLVALAAHLSSVVLLFLLCRRFLRTRWAALLAAVFFAWHALGRVAFLRKADNPYVLSLPFLLGALYCLYRLEREASRRWGAGCFLCLLLAVGLHSMAAMLAIPGILAGYQLLAPAPGARHKAAAWLACLLPALAGGGLWAAAWLPSAASRPAGHRPIPATA
ncbi:MAG TPA: glycosyltransferase family 39 protein, partial [Bryobacterales bacterium]|nr:glycosyltransferase family 39 protein [Bryobacterales bacterium]